MKKWYCVKSVFGVDGFVYAGILEETESVNRPKDRMEKKEEQDVYYEWFASKESAQHFIRTI